MADYEIAVERRLEKACERDGRRRVGDTFA